MVDCCCVIEIILWLVEVVIKLIVNFVDLFELIFIGNMIILFLNWRRIVVFYEGFFIWIKNL